MSKEPAQDCLILFPDNEHPMTTQGYPEQLDVMWAATDSIGQVGVFFSAGEGPIAKTFLDYEDYEQEELEGHMLERPRRGECIKTSPDGINNGLQLAEAGCYVFDWSDVHRGPGKLHAYELLAMPGVPLKVDELAPEVQMFLGCVQLPGVVFGTLSWLDVESHVECLNTRYRMPFDDLPVRREGPPAQYVRNVAESVQGARSVRTPSSIISYLRRLLPR
jgi:hypothetical protein